MVAIGRGEGNRWNRAAQRSVADLKRFKAPKTIAGLNIEAYIHGCGREAREMMNLRGGVKVPTGGNAEGFL